jgi:tRNA(fMet)-specific endonuclease VapC
MVVFDTDLVIGLTKNHKDARSAYEKHKGKILICSFTWYELMAGCMDDKHKRLSQVVDSLEDTGIIHFDDTVATLAARNMVLLDRKGNCTGVVDNFIAATCIINGETLVTRNVKHFKNIPGLKVEAW